MKNNNKNLCKMSLKLVVLTLVTVSARNVHRDNIRDVYLPQTKLDFDTPYSSDGRRTDHFSGEEFHSAVTKDLGDFGEQRGLGSEFNYHNAHRASNAQGNERHHNFESINRQGNHRHTERDLESRELNSEIERESHRYGLENFGQTNINHRSIESHNIGRHQNSNQNFYGSDTREYGSSSFGQNQGRDRIDSSVHQTDSQGHQGVRRNRPESSNNDDQFYRNREQQNLKDLDRQIKENERRRDEVSSSNQELFQNNRYRGQNTQREETLRHINGNINQNSDRRVDEFHYNQQNTQNNEQSFLGQRNNEDTRNKQSERDFVSQNHNVVRHIESPNNNQQTKHQNEGHGNDENVPHIRQRHENAQRRGQTNQDNDRITHDQTFGREPSTNDQTRQDNDHSDRNQQSNGNTNRNRPYDNNHKSTKVSDNEVGMPNSGSNSNNDNRSVGRESPEGDKWIWSVENEKKPNFTTPKTVTLDDRTAIDGDKCPTGKTRIGDKCVDID
uniref:GATA zinc finger domain-containing protein 14-like n=1 Tax=Pectinophora gossypiella TaxID=13191 RepID=A0A1E1WL21_PECGO